jgi:predicted acetyltransferase
MEKFPLNEALSWGDGEDVFWSKEVREHFIFNMNENSSVFIMKKNKDKVFDETGEDKIITLMDEEKWLS